MILLACYALAAIPQQQSCPDPSQATGQVSIFVRDDLNVGDVRAFDELTGFAVPVPAELQDIRLMQIDFVGRTQLNEFGIDRPRYHADVPSATRISLPRSSGSLYRYSRDEDSGARTFGFMHIDADGQPSVVTERRGWGDGLLEDPFTSHVAVGPTGEGFLFATVPQAGGDVYEARLRGEKSVRTLTKDVPPLHVLRYGLGLSKAWGSICAEEGLLRFERKVGTQTGGQVEFVDFGDSPPVWFMGDIVLSPHGAWGATVAGQGQANSHVWGFGRTGPAKQLSVVPGAHSGAGYLPDFPFGPYMAVSADGVSASWIVEETASRELFVGRGPAVAVTDAEHVTRDLLFDDTLDEIGQTMFVEPDRLVFVAGAHDYIHIGQDRADLFSVELPDGPGELSIHNVTLSSGESQPPFIEYGTIEPDRVVWSPFEEKFLIYDGDVSDSLFVVDPYAPQSAQGSLQVLLSEIRSLDMLIATQLGVLFDVRRTETGGNQRELYRVSLDELEDGPELIATAPDDTEYLRPAVRRDGWVAFVAIDPGVQTEVLSRANVGTGALENFAVTTQHYGPALGYTRLGSVVFSINAPGATSFLLWGFGCVGTLPLLVTANSGFVLPAH